MSRQIPRRSRRRAIFRRWNKDLHPTYEKSLIYHVLAMIAVHFYNHRLRGGRQSVRGQALGRLDLIRLPGMRNRDSDLAVERKCLVPG